MKIIERYVFLILIVGGLIGFLFLLGINTTGFAIFEDEAEGFEGNFINVIFNGSAIILYDNNLTGSYISEIFDAGNDAIWNNISWVSNIPDLESLFCIDGDGDVYKSTDFGINWVLSQEDYGRTTATSHMMSNSDYLFILSTNGNEVWRSENGTSFFLVYEGFDGSSPLTGDSDLNGNLYVATASGEIWKSTDNGFSWTLKGDCNPGTNDPKGIAIDSEGYIYVVDGAGDIYKSINDGVDWVLIKDSYGGGSSTDDMVIDSNDNLYILLDKDIFKSTDLGVNWNKINDSFTSYSNNGFELEIDSNDNLYILDGVGRVFKSMDSGITWLEIGDCNNDASNNPKGFVNFIQSTSLDVNIKSCDDSECSDESWIDINDDSPQNLNLDNNRYFQYKLDFISPTYDISPEVYSVTINYDLLNTAPLINLDMPQNGVSYGYNESLNLNFSVFDADNNIDSCWYNINNGTNISLVDCLNSTFNVSGNGDYLLNFYVNDSLGELSYESVGFSVQIGAPTIILNFPIDNFLNYHKNIEFSYIPNDIDLDSCELWGNFNGEFSKNKTDLNVINNEINTFYLNLTDGEYLWNIKCNDTQGNFAFNGNKTFYVDTIAPELSLIEPSGEKTSRIINVVWSLSDASPVSCIYNVYRGENLEVGNTSINCFDNSTNFEVTIDADFVFNFYVNDSAGNINFNNLSFSVDSSKSVVTINLPSSSGSSSGGGGGSAIVIKNSGKINISKLDDFFIHPEDKKTIFLSAKNIGKIFLNNCQLKAKGDFDSWIYSNQIEGIAPGQNIDFIFDINIPAEIEFKEYIGEIGIICDEGEQFQELKLMVPRELKLIDIESLVYEKGELIIDYFFNGSEFFEEDVSIDIWLVDEFGNEIKRVQDNFKNNYEENIKRNIHIGLSEDLAGIYQVYFADSFNLDNFIKQSIVLGTSSTTGKVVFLEGKGRLASYIIFILILFGGLLIVLRGHSKYFKKKNKKR